MSEACLNGRRQILQFGRNICKPVFLKVDFVLYVQTLEKDAHVTLEKDLGKKSLTFLM